LWQEYMSERRPLTETGPRPAENIIYYGEPGSYSHMAAREYARRSGKGSDLAGNESVDEILEHVGQHGGWAVLPIENTNGGAVRMTLEGLDRLAKNGKKPVIVGELEILVDHQLMSSGPLDRVEKILTHLQAALQCSGRLKALFADLGREIPIITQDFSDSNRPLSTSRAAMMAAKDSTLAAIASEEAAKLYGLPVIWRGMQDNANNATRFIVVGCEPPEYDKDLEYKTSMIVYLKDQPGALYTMLGYLEKHGINLRQLNSYKPFTGNDFSDHGFFITIDGHVAQGNVREALDELEKEVSKFQQLGSYKKGVEIASDEDLDWQSQIEQTRERFAGQKNGSEIHLLFTLADKPGALRAALRPFAENNINLTLVDSWPTGKMGVHGFTLSFENRPSQIPVQNLIGKMQEACQLVAKVNSNSGDLTNQL